MLGCPFSYWRKMTWVMNLVPICRCVGHRWRFGMRRTPSSGPLLILSACQLPSIPLRMLPYPAFAKSRTFGGCEVRVLPPFR